MQKSAYHLHCGYKEGNKEIVALKDEQRKVQGSRARRNRKTKQLACMKKKKKKAEARQTVRTEWQDQV